MPAIITLVVLLLPDILVKTFIFRPKFNIYVFEVQILFPSI